MDSVILNVAETEFVIDRLLKISKEIRELQAEVNTLGYYVGQEYFDEKNAANKNLMMVL